jgi:diguanylate cyclase (GGDEF)-like protein
MIKLFDLKKASITSIIIITIFLVILVGVTDYYTGREISFSIFYLMPILLVTWYASRILGIYFSMLSSLEWLVADQLTNPNYSHFTVPFWNMSVRLSFFLIIVFVVSRLKLALEREKKISRTDPLTGVSNARNLYEYAEREIERARRYGHLFTAVYLDLDNFKYINDHFGHLIGDQVLKTVASALLENIRTIDLIARLGGDEFVILLPEISNEDAHKVFNRIQNILLELMTKNNWQVTCSIGMVTFTEPPSSVDTLIREADDLMYMAKRNGKNRIESRLI